VRLPVSEADRFLPLDRPRRGIRRPRPALIKLRGGVKIVDAFTTRITAITTAYVDLLNQVQTAYGQPPKTQTQALKLAGSICNAMDKGLNTTGASAVFVDNIRRWE